GALASVVIGRAAARRAQPALVILAGATLALGVASAWAELAPGAMTTLVGLAALFLAIEVAATMLDDDPFWRGPARVAAAGAEVAAALVTAWAAVVAVDRFATQPLRSEVAALVAAGLAAAAWLVAEVRRRPAEGSRL